ncbi:dihydrolipoyl dehydrogenase family protein [Halanaeroarchaeum sulfurireducens]|uniref:Dihydrolipoamide dehydrogenase n=1 Tax=Halanaeroarchaeum sulfurireducens TaxID=1604004 RepID=A0A0N9N7W4_9EURY|nr:NAD(P)/FAD-dependent oxidoreductase [Halanaeroarchaeum sulfurireducens]ALG81154.1 dihydrolipoamide dehydrogenase [Halanaeroarchaeum sulfurireducens]
MTHVAVIGAYGSAGVAGAERLAEDPEIDLTMIDDADPGGGLCILRGCMPSKEVLSATEHRFAARHDDRLVGDVPDVDIEAVVERKNDHTAEWASYRRDAVEELAERDDVEFLRETARFVDDRVLQVGDRTIEPDYVVVATGSNVNVPPIPGIDDVPVQTSADVLDATDFADTGLVIGMGVVGLELVPYLSEAGGMDLTVVEMLPQLLGQADEAFGEELRTFYEDAFDIDVMLAAQTEAIETTATGGVRMTVTHEGETRDLEAEEVFAFTGRKPALEGVDIDETSIEPGPGWVDDTLRAIDDERVYVVGDANGRQPVLHVAKEEGYHAAENIQRDVAGDSLAEYDPIHHHVVFSGLGVLPFARVGHTEESAQEAGYDPITVSQRADHEGVFKAKNVPEGLATLVVARDGTVLGYQGLHYHADAMAKTMQIVVEMELDVRRLPDRAYHPTTPEILDAMFRDASAELDR